MAKKMFDQLRYAFGLLHIEWIGDHANTSHIRRRNAQLSVIDLIKYGRCFPHIRYCHGIHECFPDG